MATILKQSDPSQVVKIKYTNYRGEISYRTIVPKTIWFGHTEWHSDEQWLLEAEDLEKKAIRHFALKDIQKWLTE